MSSELEASLLRATLDATADGILAVDLDGHVSIYNQRFLSMWEIPGWLAARQQDEVLLDFVADQLVDPLEFLHGVRDLYRSERDSFDVLHFKDGRVFERCSRPQWLGEAMVGRVWSFHDVSSAHRMLENIEFLSEASRLLVSLDLARALEGLVGCAVPLLGESAAADLLEGGVARRVACAASGTAPPPPLLCRRGLTTAGTIICHHRGRCHLEVPLAGHGEPFGVLSFVGQPGRRYSIEDREMAAELGRRAGLAIQNARLFEQAREAVRARDEILSTTAHEIRGPITSIRLAAQTLLEEERADSPRLSMLNLIERADRRLARFVDELIDVSRLRTGVMAFEFEKVDLREVIREVCARLEQDLVRSGSPLTLRLDGDLTGEWDRLRVDQIVSNLLSNAIKFGQGRPIRVVALPSGRFAKLIVRDHGCGIPADRLEAVFRPFERAGATQHLGGLGLGLYIVKSIVLQLGGEVRIWSKVGLGTRLTVCLPRRRRT